MEARLTTKGGQKMERMEERMDGRRENVKTEVQKEMMKKKRKKKIDRHAGFSWYGSSVTQQY